MKILHLIDCRDDPGSTRRLGLLAPALAAEDAVEICCLGSGAGWTDSLRQAGIAVHALHWMRWFDPAAVWNLRRVLRSSAADAIHVWHLSALRALAIAAPGLLPRVVITTPPLLALRVCDRWLLRRVICRPPVDLVAPAAERQRDAAAPRIACAGRVEREEGMRQAIWAFDFLLLLYPDAELHIAGRGSQLESLQALAQGLGNAARVRFHGAKFDWTDALRDADIIWVPSLADVGRQVALEGMALGKAVIASDVPGLREVIRDNETGFLVPPGDVIALARRTHALLADRSLRERIGAAARSEVARQFSVAAAVQRMRETYRSIAA